MIQWIYVTDDNEPNPYDTLPNYLSDLAELLNTANGNKHNKPDDYGMSLRTKIIIELIIAIITITVVGFVIRYRMKLTGDAGNKASLNPSGAGNQIPERGQTQGLHLSTLSSKD